jgi:hypothetical protein
MLKSSVAFLSLALVTVPSFAATCTIPAHNNATSGDNFYRPSTCNQAMSDQFWDHFDFDRDDWDNGFGYEDVCNVDRPLLRTYNALYLLAYSAEDYAKNTGDFSGNALRWAYPYSATVTDELDARCGDGSANATSFTGAFVDDRVELYLGFFYGLSVAERAGTIVHESRHQGGKNHNGGSGCPRGRSCDTNWAYHGANMFHVLYLWWFAVDGTRTTTAMRDLARNRARIVHNTAFNTNPGFSI